MANNASQSSSLSHNLLVSGLWPTSNITEKTLALLSHIRLSLASDHVKYMSHRLTSQGDEQAALLELEVGEDLLDDFCDAFMQHEIFDKLRKLSKWGLLGFQPVEGTEFAQHWHKAVFKSAYVDGAEKMEVFQLEALNLPNVENIPEWFQVLNFVADTAIEGLLIATINPLDMAEKEATRTKRLEQKKYVMEKGESMAAQLCCKWTKQQSSGRSDAEINSEARKVYKDLFGTIGAVCRRLEKAQGQRSSEPCNNRLPEAVQITMFQRRELFNELYDLTTKAYMTFSLTEELMRFYTKEMWKFRAEAAVKCIGFTWTVRAMLLRTPTWTAIAGSMYSLVTIANTVRGAYQAQLKEDHCKQLAHLIWQTWQTAAETNTYLRWVHTTNNEVTFVEGCGRKWEEQLKLKLDGDIQNDWKDPKYLKIYLKDRLDELKVVKSDIQSRSEVLFP